MISTCGTSLLTNANPEERGELTKLMNKTEAELSSEEKGLIDRCISNSETHLASCHSIEAQRNASAEINTILTFYEHQLAKGIQDVHHLYYTDTYVGEQTAKILEKWFQKNGLQNTTTYCCEKLNTKSVADFRAAIAKLARKLAEEIPGWQKSNYHIIFQLSGGFKSVQGFMQTAGMFFADEIILLFEGSKELIHIPQIPMKLDDAVIGVVRDNLAVFRLFGRSKDGNGTLAPNEVGQLIDSELCVERVNDMVALTPWGTFCWEHAKKDIYAEEIHPSPHERLKYGPNFESTAKKWCESAELKYDLNKTIDDLAIYIDTQYNPKSLKVKPKEGAGHLYEFYVRHGGPAIRGFLSMEGETLTITHISDHLPG